MVDNWSKKSKATKNTSDFYENHSDKTELMFIYSLDILCYFVRNLDVTRCFISSISTSLRTCTNVAQEHLRSDALPDTTVIRRKLNTDLSFERPMPYQLHHGHSPMKITQISPLNYQMKLVIRF